MYPAKPQRARDWTNGNPAEVKINKENWARYDKEFEAFNKRRGERADCDLQQQKEQVRTCVSAAALLMFVRFTSGLGCVQVSSANCWRRTVYRALQVRAGGRRDDSST